MVPKWSPSQSLARYAQTATRQKILKNYAFNVTFIYLLLNSCKHGPKMVPRITKYSTILENNIIN